MTEPTLKPCPIPWCGGNAEMRQGYPDMRERFIICLKCSLRTRNSKPFDDKGAAELWNRERREGNQ